MENGCLYMHFQWKIACIQLMLKGTHYLFAFIDC